MGLHRREMAASSSVRRQRGPSGVPGTAPVGGGGLVQHVDTYTTGQSLNVSQWVGTAIFECTGAGGDGYPGPDYDPTGGGGGAYAKTTITLPFVDTIVELRFDGSFSGPGAISDNFGVLCYAADGDDGIFNDGLGGTDVFGDLTHTGGNGGPLGGGRAATAAGNGANNSPGNPKHAGDGGDLNGAGQPGKIVVTWYGLN